MLGRSLYVFSAKMGGYAIRLIVPMFLVRLLDQTAYGIYGQFFLLEVIIASIFQFGVNQSLFYFIPRDEKNAGTYFANTLVMNILSYSVAFAAIFPLRHQIGAWANMTPLVDHFWQLVLYTVFLMLITAADCYLCARQRIAQSAAFEIGGQLLASVATVGAAYATRDTGMIFAALVVARLVHLLAILGYVIVKLHGLHGAHLLHKLGAQIRYGFVLGVGGTAWSLTMRMHPLMVNKVLGTDAFAVYRNGITDLPVVQFYLQSLAVVSLGRFAIMEKAEDWEGIRRLWREILAGLYGVVIPFTAFFVLLAEPLIIFMFTDQYAAAVPIFRVNTLIKLSMLWNAQLVLRAMDRNDVTLKVYGAQLLLSIPVLWVGLHFGGMIGVIVCQAVLEIGGRLASQVWLNRISRHPLPYLSTPREVWAFYRLAWASARRRLRQRLQVSGRA